MRPPARSIIAANTEHLRNIANLAVDKRRLVFLAQTLGTCGSNNRELSPNVLFISTTANGTVERDIAVLERLVPRAFHPIQPLNPLPCLIGTQ